jgi:hypothetical protein
MPISNSGQQILSRATCGNESSPGAYLPVYEVVGTGIEEEQAKRLAKALEVPLDKIFFREGIVHFVDPVEYLAVPTVPKVDNKTVATLRAATTNHHPEIPIVVRAIDHAALQRLKALDPDEAFKLTSAALDSAGLTPEHATPVVGHTVFKTVSTAERTAPVSTTTNLDTQVSYRFTLDGYLLVGPGAQVQVSYGPHGRVTRLLHSLRKLKSGPLVRIIPADEIRGRFARFLPDNAEVKLRLVYWAPPLRTAVYRSSSRWNPTTILPWYAVTVTQASFSPRTRAAEKRTSRVHLIPATDDPRFVPSVTLRASAREESLVEAEAFATGGTPPYTYLWGGSNPEASSATGNSVRYVPLARDFRRVQRAQSLQRTESVSVTVVDANGVSAGAGQSVFVTARPAPDTHNSVTYGCESPNDPGPSPQDGSYTPERIAWQQAMGAPGQGGGSQRFCWLADDSWPGDFIEPDPPGLLEPSAWINGDADYSNWGINSTNIMLYNGDGWPGGFAEMYPGATPADYNTGGGASLGLPGTPADVQIGGQNYTVSYSGSWGAPAPNDHLQWLAMYACEILEDDASAPSPWLRWGPAFNGLHSLLGFETDASDAGVGFMTDFPANILGYIPFSIFGNTLYFPQAPTTVVQGWLSSAIANQMGTPAAMGPTYNGICDYGDYYWGKGPVGPTIPQSLINGWWYIQGTGPMQDFP